MICQRRGGGQEGREHGQELSVCAAGRNAQGRSLQGGDLERHTLSFREQCPHLVRFEKEKTEQRQVIVKEVTLKLYSTESGAAGGWTQIDNRMN